jgi:cytochrome P450
MDPYGFFDRRRARYGDVFDVRVTGQRWTVLCDPAAVQEVFRHGPEDLNSGEANEPLRPLIGRRNVLLLDGDEHLARRKLVLPPFHGDRMRAYEGIVRAACDEAFDALPLGEPVAMLPVVQDVTYEVILRAVFGIDEAARVVALRDALRELLEWTIKLRNAFVFSYLGPDRLIRMRAFQRRRRVVDRLVHEQIAQRRTDPSIASRTDILSLLLQARFEDGSALTDLDVRDELVTLLLAGHDTTSAELTWAIDALAWAPDVGGPHRRRREGARRRRLERDAAPAPAAADRRAVASPAADHRRHVPADGCDRRAVRHGRPPPRRSVARPPIGGTRAAGSAARAPPRGPTSRSAAACGAASAPRSRPSRRGSC